MKFRRHRQLLEESMKTVVELEPTMAALVTLLRDQFRSSGLYPEDQIVAGISPETVTVKPYVYDKRIDWDTYIVHSDAMGVFGFTDGPLSEGTENAKQIGQTGKDDASSGAR